jgi:hypothetical protein
MRTLVELIERYSGTSSEFRYYIPIIDEAERNEIAHPDITIECCASLFQGISKTIVYRLDPPTDRKEFENQNIARQVAAAFKCLMDRDDVVELDFARRAHSLVQVLGELRNARGDISHGRAAPKELESDRSLSRLALNVTEAVIRYMLASFFTIEPLGLRAIPYEVNEGFNAHLDRRNPLDGKPLYSLALYQQYYEDYLIQLDLFLEGEIEGAET